jgi:lysophospholipase L1-like esterase
MSNESPKLTWRVRAKRLCLKLFLCFFSIALTLVALEIALRIIQPGPPERLSPQIEHIYVPCDPKVGRVSDYYLMAANRKGFHLNVPVETNSLGLRSAEPDPNKPADLYRIVALGDSHTFGFGVEEDQTWPRLLEQKLKEKWRGRKLEVINGGVQALAIEQEIQLFRDKLLALKPDVVILAYYWNDMPMVGRPFEPWTETDEMIPPTMVPRTAEATGNSQASPSSGGLYSSVKNLMKKSYLAYNIMQRIPALQRTVNRSAEGEWKAAVLNGDTSPRITASWKFVEKKLVELQKLGAEQKFDVVVVLIPIFEQMLSTSYTNAAYQTEILRICKAKGIAAVDPLAAVQASQPSYPDCFIPFDGHPNGRIYRVIADELADHLAKNKKD